MTDHPIREPLQPDPRRDRNDEPETDEEPSSAAIRPSAAEGAEEDGGGRPPRPSQAEGEREES